MNLHKVQAYIIANSRLFLMFRNGSFVCFHLVFLWPKIQFWGTWRGLVALGGVCGGEDLGSWGRTEDKALI